MTFGSLQAYLDSEIREILQKCTACGICAQVCPILPYTALKGMDSREVVAAVLETLREAHGNAASASWIEACAGSGVCIKACPEPVNPRRMLLLARNKLKGKG